MMEEYQAERAVIESQLDRVSAGWLIERELRRGGWLRWNVGGWELVAGDMAIPVRAEAVAQLHRAGKVMEQQGRVVAAS